MRTVVLKDGNEVLSVRGDASDSSMDDWDDLDDEDYLAPMLNELTDSDLRKIFSGLCGESL